MPACPDVGLLEAAEEEGSSDGLLTMPTAAAAASSTRRVRRLAGAGLAASLGLLAVAAAWAPGGRPTRLDARSGPTSKIEEPILPGASGSDVSRALLKVTYRDFANLWWQWPMVGADAHPDFQPTYAVGNAVTKGLVEETLDADDKPVFHECCDSAPCTCHPLSTGDNFNHWYRDKAGMNIKVEDFISLDSVDTGEDGKKVFKFEDDNFFPLNGRGWNDMHLYVPYNYYFTMECSHLFIYHGGEYFKFHGDDDLWVFFNHKLALDLGGIHASLDGEISLDDLKDELGLELEKAVTMHIFFAERRFPSSVFKIETTLQLDEDPCKSFDRVNLDANPTGDLTWKGEAFAAGSSTGTEVSMSFSCDEGDCGSATSSAMTKFPAILLAGESGVTLTLTVSPDPGFQGLELTFYDLEENQSVFAKGAVGFVKMTGTSIEYSGKDDKDFDGFYGTATRAAADEQHDPFFPLTEAQKNKMVSLTLNLDGEIQIILNNSGGQEAAFIFYVAPMIKCIPCSPECQAGEPEEVTRTTTTTTSSTSTSTTEQASELASVATGNATGDYRCCLWGFTIPFMEIWTESPEWGCSADRPFWKPWCPDPDASTTAEEVSSTNSTNSSEYTCCLWPGFTIPVIDYQVPGPLCQNEKPVWMPWCPEPPP